MDLIPSSAGTTWIVEGFHATMLELAKLQASGVSEAHRVKLP